MPVTDHEHELDGPVTLRRQPASLSNGHPGGNTSTSTFEIICRPCGDDPGLDYRQISPGLHLPPGVPAVVRDRHRPGHPHRRHPRAGVLVPALMRLAGPLNWWARPRSAGSTTPSACPRSPRAPRRSSRGAQQGHHRVNSGRTPPAAAPGCGCGATPRNAQWPPPSQHLAPSDLTEGLRTGIGIMCPGLTVPPRAKTCPVARPGSDQRFGVRNLRSRPVIRMILLVMGGVRLPGMNGPCVSRDWLVAMRTSAARPWASQKASAVRSAVTGPWWLSMTSLT